MSESSLLRQLKRITGLTPQQYLLEMRLDKARQLLEARSGASIANIAAEVGYTDIRSFARSFKQRFGKPASEV
jgi:AraC-like DNA-binding protein